MDPETRAYLDEMRQEFRGDIAALRGEMRQGDEALRGEMRQGDADTRRELGAQIEALRGEMRQGDADTRRELGVLIEAQRHDLAAVAEVVAANTVAIDRLGRKMDDRFETVRLAFVGLRRDIAALRARRRRKPRGD